MEILNTRMNLNYIATTTHTYGSRWKQITLHRTYKTKDVISSHRISQHTRTCPGEKSKALLLSFPLRKTENLWRHAPWHVRSVPPYIESPHTTLPIPQRFIDRSSKTARTISKRYFNTKAPVLTPIMKQFYYYTTNSFKIYPKKGLETTHLNPPATGLGLWNRSGIGRRGIYSEIVSIVSHQAVIISRFQQKETSPSPMLVGIRLSVSCASSASEESTPRRRNILPEYERQIH